MPSETETGRVILLCFAFQITVIKMFDHALSWESLHQFITTCAILAA